MKIVLIILVNCMLLSEDKYKEPAYELLSKDGNIEIRQYGEYVVAKTSVSSADKHDNNMFRTLASYIFGGNKENQSIPMTAPVTTYENSDSYNMIFYMLDADNINDMPEPNGQNIEFESFRLGKCAVISFSWFTSQSRIDSFTIQLKNYIEKNNIIPRSAYMVNRYDPPWKVPFMRRNEIIVQIN